jgi:hypothetical protein
MCYRDITAAFCSYNRAKSKRGNLKGHEASELRYGPLVYFPWDSYPTYHLATSNAVYQQRAESCISAWNKHIFQNALFAILQPPSLLHINLSETKSTEKQNQQYGCYLNRKIHNLSIHYPVQTGSVAHPASYPRGTSALSLRVRRPGHEANHSPLSCAEIKNAWSYTSIPNTSS